MQHLTPSVVNGQIFPNVIQGFMDTNPIVREHTIKVRALTDLRLILNDYVTYYSPLSR